MADVLRKAPSAVRLGLVVLVVALILLAVFVLTGGGTKKGTAYFTTANSINPGDSVAILGIEVGKVDRLTPMGDRVRVDFHYDGKYTLPAEVKAAVLSPTLVATRFVQLDPAYTAGPEFPDGGTIPLERTVVPVEFDELKKQLDRISEDFGPNGVNRDGAINRALTAINRNGMQNGVGQGQAFHDMVVELSKAAKTLSDGRGDLFGTVDNLARFAGVLNRYDDQIVQFQQRLGDVSDTLDGNSDQLRELLPRIDDAGKQVDQFLEHHGAELTTTIDRAGSVSRALAKVRDSLAQALHIGPNTLTNFTNLMHPRTGNLVGAVEIGSFGTSLLSPGNQVCGLITTVSAANPLTAQETCVKQLGPLFAQLLKVAPQVAEPLPTIPLVPGIVAPYGRVPSYGDLNSPDRSPNTNASPNGSNSDLPRSGTANNKDHSYTDNGFPIPGIPTPNPRLGGN